MSFCTTCMGRAYQLKRTLPINLTILRHYPGSEIVLLNYNSADDLDNWVKSRLMSEIDAGLISYYFTSEPSSFFMAHAKNVAHRLARGGMVCNLDADHLLTREFVEELAAAFILDQCDRILAAQAFGIAFGRTALQKALFIKLGGYNEEMSHGWGYEDVDLRLRAEGLGIKLQWTNSAYLSYLEHGDEERGANSVNKQIRISEKMHAEISRINIARGAFVANAGAHWGKASLTRNFSEMITI